MDRLVRNAVDENLQAFANAVGPCKKYWKEGKMAVQKIVNCLNQARDNGGFNIGWMLYNGSVGKRTALRESDFDVLLFINAERPPLDDCLIHFKQILLRNKHGLGIEDVKRTPHAIQFKIPRCEINVDLVPAANYLERNPDGLRQRNRIAEQHRRALAALESERSPVAAASSYSTSLSAYQRQFILDLGDFNAEACRLAKLWFKSLFIGKPAYGSKTLLELIMAASVIQEENGSLLSVFNRFLTKIISLEKDAVKIQFIKQLNGRWSLGSPTAAGTRGGYVIDPSNPYNDFLKGTKAKPVFLANLVKSARTTKKRMEAVPPFKLIEMMFAPQYHPSGEFHLKTKEIRDVIFDQELVYKSRNPDMKINRKFEKLRQQDYVQTLEMVKAFLVASVNASAFSPDNCGKDPSEVIMETGRKCQGMLASEVLGTGGMNWSMTNTSYDTCDVVFTVPVPNPFPSSAGNVGSNNIGAIKFGFSWVN